MLSVQWRPFCLRLNVLTAMMRLDCTRCNMGHHWHHHLCMDTNKYTLCMQATVLPLWTWHSAIPDYRKTDNGVSRVWLTHVKQYKIVGEDRGDGGPGVRVVGVGGLLTKNGRGSDGEGGKNGAGVGGLNSGGRGSKPTPVLPNKIKYLSGPWFFFFVNKIPNPDWQWLSLIQGICKNNNCVPLY